MRPAEHAREWWLVDHSAADATVDVTPETVIGSAPAPAADDRGWRGSLALLAIVTLALTAAAWRVVVERPALARLSVAGA